MTLHTAQGSGRREGRRRIRARGFSLLVLLFAVGLSLAVVLPFAHWTLRWSMLEFIVPWLLRPATGFLPLTLTLWIVFTVPSTLRHWAGGGQGDSEVSDPVDVDPDARQPVPPASEPAKGEMLSIPAVTFRELGAGHRWEMAEALGIPWRDELIHDHQSWAVACLEAAQHRAAERHP